VRQVIAAIRAERSIFLAETSVCGENAISRQERQWLLYAIICGNIRIFLLFFKD
jgi:hypothetical protein